ncbi:MAG: protein kinase domain-containing protein [bacterium]
MSLSPGTRLGHYEIVSPLGAGGMGEVYRARDTRLDRDVAIKVLPDAVARDADRLARFEREAKTVAALNHPNIVTLFSVEDDGGTRFLTMELVEGESLALHVTEGGLPVARVVDLGIALADALTAAHEKGVVHRDLKPANVMLTRDGRVKVLDFGIAKLSAPDSEIAAAHAATVTTPMSTSGQIVGTVPYMAPEQVRGGAIDGRTDVFALGIVLYELATGRRPFDGSTAADVTSAILRDAPAPLMSARADLPADLDRIVARCLEKEPRARFQTALDVSDELRRARLTREGSAIAKPPPTPSTPLLGRDETLDSAARRLRAGARVLTITGYGGTGKTRFAIELLRRMAPEYAGGAAFVSLASVTAATEVLPTVGIALDIAEAHGRSALDALCTVIGDRRVLLVLDNLEQVLAAAEEIAALVARCPALQVIATSRAPLKIGAESEFALPPLELPAQDATSLDLLAKCPSVALLVQRAEKVKPGFALTAANASAIAAICRRLDGLPLALELAAARVRILEPAALLQRLDHALDLLTSGDRDLPVRQRTLRATISWSYSLLDATEQQLLRRASVFHEGWTLEAMERVCYGEDDRHRALDDLDSLVEKGLVRVVGSGERYALLETIRAFSAEQLHAGGEVDAIRQAHADYFVEFASVVASDIFGIGQLDAVRRARGDNANTLAAIQWLSVRARAGDAAALEKGLLLCGNLDWFWHIGGQHFTARLLLDPLLGLAADAPPSRGRALSRLAAGMVSTTTGEWERSRGEWAGAYEDGKAVGDAAAAAEGIMGVGYCNLSLGNMDEARAALDEGIARSAGGVADFIHALSMSIKGMLLFVTGDLDSGVALVEQARRIHERMNDREGLGVALSFLAQMTFAKGDHDGALVLYRDALAALEAVGDHPEIARVHCEMGWTALSAADARAAKREFRLAVQAYQEVGSPRGTGLALLGLAAVEAADGRPERAVAIAAAAQALSERAGVVIAHPMDPGLAGRIEALKASIPKGMLDGLVANASTLSPAAVLAMVFDA